MTSDRILLSHGGGGVRTHRLIAERILARVESPELSPLLDSAVLPSRQGRLAMTTDSFVVQPLFFPGGDIGRLAVCGTVNDLAAVGAVPRYLSLAFILEEGLLIEEFERALDSIASACREAGVSVVTGDTKVVERGAADGMFINTSGIGWIPEGRELAPSHIQPGDAVLVTGTLGDHGIAILSRREGLTFETELLSDVAPLNHLAEAIHTAAPHVRCMRDPTRGGAAMVLGELAVESRTGLFIDEAALPVRPEVSGACEMLGLDPLYVANEGKFIVVVPADEADTALAAMRKHPLGLHAARLGTARAEHPGKVVLLTRIGGRRVVEMPLGEALPRIC